MIKIQCVNFLNFKMLKKEKVYFLTAFLTCKPRNWES